MPTDRRFYLPSYRQLQAAIEAEKRRVKEIETFQKGDHTPEHMRSKPEPQLQAGTNSWTEWRGGGCPAPWGTLVDVKLRSGDVYCLRVEMASRWRHTGSLVDIVAYRVANVDFVAAMKHVVLPEAAVPAKRQRLEPKFKVGDILQCTKTALGMTIGERLRVQAVLWIGASTYIYRGQILFDGAVKRISSVREDHVICRDRLMHEPKFKVGDVVRMREDIPGITHFRAGEQALVEDFAFYFVTDQYVYNGLKIGCSGICISGLQESWLERVSPPSPTSA